MDSRNTSRPRSTAYIALFSLVALILVCLQQVAGSPPVDYFIYTSQEPAVAQAKPGAQTLPSLNSIYTGNEGSKTDAHLRELSDRVLAAVSNMSHTHDNDMIDLETSQYAWHLMEKQALTYTKNRVDILWPFLDSLIKEAQVSDPCRMAIKDWMEHLKKLDHWATLMWNSWGEFPPAGLFEGSFTDLGSYRGCISVPDNELIGQAQYCTLDFQPIVPTRPRFHSIFKRVLDIDGNANQLTGGDFPADSLSSRQSAHQFSSAKFQPNKTLTGVGLQVSRYSKRTIVHNGTEDTLSAQQEAISSSSNLTLKAEALIELARKAQYFYYVKFRVGTCLPSKCSVDDVRKLAQTAGQRTILQTNQVNCLKKEPTSLNKYQKIAIWILTLLALVAILGTTVDLLGYKDNGDSSFTSWLLVFSIWTNSRRLFDSDTAGSHGDLECVHGLRFFSMLWVIYGHTILYTEYQSFTHFYDVVETQISSFLLLPSLNANFSVDTFFVISGILTTYVTWEYTKGDPRKFNKFAFLISRYIRLTPQLAIVILCFFLLPLFGDGPMYKKVTEEQAEVCYSNWAINLLYLQSYVNSEKLCIDPSWWLSIEMSFHVISVLIIIVMIHNPRRGMIVNFIVAAVLTLWGAIIHYKGGFAIQYLPSIPQRYEISREQTQVFFHRPYPHAASYFIGIALGYVLANRTVKKLSKSQLYQGWIVCAIGILIPLWGTYYWNLGAPYTQLQATLYYNICQILWPISIAWVIFACSLGHGGCVDAILSAKCFVPLGRITYMTYLSHALIIYFHSACMNIPVEPSMLLFTYLFIANTFLALALGVILTVVYESPILNLQKHLFSYLTQRFDPTIQNQMRQVPTTIVCESE